MGGWELIELTNGGSSTNVEVLFQQNVKRVHWTEAPCSLACVSIEFSLTRVKAAL